MLLGGGEEGKKTSETSAFGGKVNVGMNKREMKQWRGRAQRKRAEAEENLGISS